MTSIRILLFFILTFSLQDIYKNGHSVVTGWYIDTDIIDTGDAEVEDPLFHSEEIPSTYNEDVILLHPTTEEQYEEQNVPNLENDILEELGENTKTTQSEDTKTEPETENLDEDLKESSTILNPKDQTTNSTSSSEVSCKDDIKSLKLEKRYAFSVFFKTNWFRAYQYCKYHDMQLATINSLEEELVLESTLGKIGYDLREIWTAGTDKGEEGHFNWMSTGTPFTYTNWYQGEPNGGKRENCVTIFRATEGYFWNDVVCDHEHYFACEYYTAEKTDAPIFV